MSGLIQVIGITVIAVLVTIYLKQYKPEFSFAFATAVGAILLIFALLKLFHVAEQLESLFNLIDFNSSVFNILLKCLGITTVVDFTSDLCKDFGQNSLGNKIVLVGKIVVVTMCLPMISGIIKSAMELV